MNCNVGTIDRIVRAVLGVGLIIAGIVVQGWALIPGILVGAVLLGTVAFKFCPIYWGLGIKTCAPEST